MPATRRTLSARDSTGSPVLTDRVRAPRTAPSTCARAPRAASPPARRGPFVRSPSSPRPRPISCSRSLSTSVVCLRPRWSSPLASAWASSAVMRPRSTASSSASSMRSRVSITRSSGRIRFLRSDSRNSATVFASAPAPPAARPARRAVVLAPLRAFCWRARAWPPFLAAALRADEPREEPERLDDELERERLEALDRDPLDRDDPLPRDERPLLDELPLEDRPPPLLPEDRPPEDRPPDDLPEPPLPRPLLPPLPCAISLPPLDRFPVRRAFHAPLRTISCRTPREQVRGRKVESTSPARRRSHAAAARAARARAPRRARGPGDGRWPARRWAQPDRDTRATARRGRARCSA